MKHLYRFIAALACGASFPVGAETLKADAIACETERPIALLSKSNLTNQSGSEVMKRVSATAQFYGLLGDVHQIRIDSANKERAIRQESGMTEKGAISARTLDARAAQQQSADAGSSYAEFISSCTATPDKEQRALVIERRPISQSVKIKTMLRGTEYELWTKDSYLKPE